jgi:hypothetical protein
MIFNQNGYYNGQSVEFYNKWMIDSAIIWYTFMLIKSSDICTFDLTNFSILLRHDKTDLLI